MIKNYYKVYGLKIESEIEISEFISIKEEELNDEKVNFKYGKMPEKFNEILKEGHRMFIDKNEVWFYIKGVASYHIYNGNTVVVELCEDPNMELVNIYLMCSCLGFIMLQRDVVAIHGGVIDMDGKAMIFTGDRGAGKSTLTTALRKKGYNFISDDVASVSFTDGKPYVEPGFPYQKLCSDAMDKLGYDKEKCNSFMSDTQVKYMVPAHEEFTYDSTELFGICEITVGDVEEVKIEEYKGSDKLNKIIANIYRGEYISHLGGLAPRYFKQCVDIAKNIKFFKITRPKNQFTVEAQIELVENKIRELEEVAV